MITVPRIVTFGSLVLLMSSCAVHSGMISNSQLGSKKYYQFEDISAGYAKATYFLGIGGLRKDALINDAKRNLYLSYPLKPNQVFDNITLDRKTTYILPFSKVEVILVADVVELDSGHQLSMRDRYLKALTQSAIRSKGYLSNYEPVLLLENGQAYPGRVVSINRGNATIFYINSDGFIRVGSIPYRGIYKISNLVELQSKVGVNIGDVWTFSLHRSNSTSYNLQGKVIGINSDFLLIENKSGAQSLRINEIRSKN